MASYSLLEFLGSGVLKNMGGKFAEDGWDDVPTLKVIGAQDMDALSLTNSQRDALELRTYLHDRSLMKYADRMETSRLGLIDLMNMKPSDLSSKFRMRKTHVAKFVDTTISCGVQMPPDLVASSITPRRRRRPSAASEAKSPEIKRPLLKSTLPFSIHKSILSDDSSLGSVQGSPPRKSNSYEMPASLRTMDVMMPNSPKGVFAAPSNARLRMCGLAKAASAEKVTKLSVLERISLRPLAPDHRNGVAAEKLKGVRKLQPFHAAGLWAHKATLFFCIRRPGCVMCRAEAHQLFARKPLFDALGIQLVAVLLEDLDEEVWAFWPRYWAGPVVLDEKRDFFRALGGGQLRKANFLTGFLFNPIARLNFRRALKTGIQYNAKGEGWIRGGLFIVRRGNGGVAYQFVERNVGDWAPLDEVLQVCQIIKEERDNYGY